ncbi:response regulator transcription factor [Paenibacillus agilis]|uniref:Response regulator transcription factor n=1 Tax=Paenibacillus agilis TaxID=3020863 RepID=A0A559IL40_9BACL|nr:response regulator transcription factor [Paenibacillus agilis]TVX88193.1 response regulator transcription factor [Paenibacillus agilis]
MYKILIVEDDPKIAELLASHIEKYGYDSIVIQDFGSVQDEFQRIQPHIVVMDVNLPSYDGYYWCRQIRMVSTCPILFLSARSGEMDQVLALESGADDYITKPFSREIVMAKIRSQIRRVYGDYAIKERMVEKYGMMLYPERLELHLKGSMVPLTKKEAVLIETLLEACPRIVKRDAILDKLWDDESYIDDNTLSVNITRLRKKLSDLDVEDALETVRGVGYRLNQTWSIEGQS